MKRILLLQPDPGLRDQLTFLLQHSGFEVASTGEGQQALVEIDRGYPDLIVVAEDSCELNGDELCPRIRQISDAPIMILGQDAEEAAGVEFLEMGADAYLTSPLNPTELLARIRSLLRRTKGEFQGT